MVEYGYNLDIAQFFDCSGYVIDGLTHFKLFYGDATADQLFNLGTNISIKGVKPGDLVFLGSEAKKTHVGVYVGDGRCYECKGRDDGVSLQLEAHDSCNELLALIQIAQEVFHLRTNRMKYWGNLIIETRGLIKSWHEKDRKRQDL